MSDFLDRLVSKALAPGPLVRPRSPSAFEPTAFTGMTNGAGFTDFVQPDVALAEEGVFDPGAYAVRSRGRMAEGTIQQQRPLEEQFFAHGTGPEKTLETSDAAPVRRQAHAPAQTSQRRPVSKPESEATIEADFSGATAKLPEPAQNQTPAGSVTTGSGRDSRSQERLAERSISEQSGPEALSQYRLEVPPPMSPMPPPTTTRKARAAEGISEQSESAENETASLAPAANISSAGQIVGRRAKNPVPGQPGATARVPEASESFVSFSPAETSQPAVAGYSSSKLEHSVNRPLGRTVMGSADSAAFPETPPANGLKEPGEPASDGSHRARKDAYAPSTADRTTSSPPGPGSPTTTVIKSLPQKRTVELKTATPDSPSEQAAARSLSAGAFPSGVHSREVPQVPAPSVHITIGRVEVRAVPPATPNRRASAPAPKLSLDEYLKRGKGGRQ